MGVMIMKKLKILYEDKDLLVVRKDDKVLTVSDGKSYNTLYSEVYDYLHKKNHEEQIRSCRFLHIQRF